GFSKTSAPPSLAAATTPGTFAPPAPGRVPAPRPDGARSGPAKPRPSTAASPTRPAPCPVLTPNTRARDPPASTSAGANRSQPPGVECRRNGAGAGNRPNRKTEAPRSRSCSRRDTPRNLGPEPAPVPSPREPPPPTVRRDSPRPPPAPDPPSLRGSRSARRGALRAAGPLRAAYA